MWNRISGKSSLSKDDSSLQNTRRNNDEQRQSARYSSIASSNSNKKSSSRVEDRDPRGFNPTSTSYSSTTREQYPGAASASIASSYATASGNSNGEYVAPGLVRNASLADQMPRSSSSRSSRDQNGARESRDRKRDKTKKSDSRDQDVERRHKRDKRDEKDKSLRRSENISDDEAGTSRGPNDFPDQVASSGFSQFPGQYDGAIPVTNGVSPEHPAMSSHVQDQFPGQFPTQSSAPYRPPLAANEGGPGLAAEYYGDDGQSVAEQPGNRANTPSLIIGAEPHLQAALAVAAPPPEPSASGAVGAAASFFSGEFEEDEAAPTLGPHSSATYVTGQIRPNSSYHSSSAPVIPTIGGALMGSTASHFIGSQTSSHQQRPDHESPTGGPPSEYSTIMTHRPPSQTQDSNYPSASRPPKPGKQSSQSSNTPIYAAGVVGATGLAAAAYEHNHHSSNQYIPSTSLYSTASMAQRHRNRGPLGALVDFFKDPEGVAQFEEYSQIVGVCRHCFAPGSSPRDAPRKHFYGRRRSNERYGSSTRVDKDSRYYSSENEGRRKNKSWLATGLAGYGLAKVGESLSKEKDDSDATYSVGTGRFPRNGGVRRARHRSRSKERVEIGITGDDKSGRKESRDSVSNGTKRTTHSTRRHSRTRSRSSDRKNGFTEAAIGPALGISMVASSSRRQSHSLQGTSVEGKHRNRASSSERRRKTKKEKRDKGFFSFGNGSSSSSSMDLAYGGSLNEHRSSRKPDAKSREDTKAEAALIGLGAAAAALALNDGRQSHKRRGVKENVGMTETQDHHRHTSTQFHRSKDSSGNSDDELWESAAEDGSESVNSDLAYGAPRRRDSRASLSSESSGTNKWGWRWGSKKNRRTSSPRRKSADHSSFSVMAGTAGPGLTDAAIASPDYRQGNAMESTSSLPLQHVYPVPTSDPSRFDVGREGSTAFSDRPVMTSRPEAVPIQHPRPIAPVSAAIYSNQTAYDHSYSAPAGPAVFSQTPYHHFPGASDARSNTHEASIPSSFPRFEQQAGDVARDFKIRRRDTSPARFGEDSISSSMAPRRRNSTKDDSGVRFDLTEEQEERDRRERRRKRKQDKEHREAEEQEQIQRERHTSKEQSSKKPGSKTNPEAGPDKFSEKAWTGPAVAGVIGAAIGVAAATDRSKIEETREERRERRRRERELEDEEEALSKSERRRKQRERDDREAAIKERRTLPDKISASSKSTDRQGRLPEKQDMSIWQEAASTKRSSSHEDYGAFFTPLELLNKSNDQVKTTSANADADIELEQVPQIIMVEPKRIHDLSKSPAFSLADTDDQVDASKLSFPWQVPKLRLVEPTPPSTRGSTPIPQPKDASDEGFEEPRKEPSPSPSPSKVRWADDQTHEYTIIAPKEDHDESIEAPSKEISDTDSVSLPRSTHEHDLPDDETQPHVDSTSQSKSASFGEDTEFAATLAASAEDAGFDPSIVISNPMYRRRDSPPGSNERSMPGEFDDEDEPRLNKKERKRKEKASRRRNQNDGPNQRDDEAVVQDIINQVEESESQPSNQIPSEMIDNEWESAKKSKSKKPKKGRKGSEPREDLFEASESASKSLASESRDVYESPTDDVRVTTSSAIILNEAESGSKSNNKSKGNSAGFDDGASAESSQITTEATKDSKPKSKDKPKGSIWDRVLGKSNGSLPQDNHSEDVTEEVNIKDFQQTKKKSKRSKERNFTRDGDDGQDSKERSSIASTATQVSGRISQDLPAKDQGTNLPPTMLEAGSVAQYLDHGTELERTEEKLPESFLGMRPEPPPPPDTRAESEKVLNPLETTSLPDSPRAESEAQSRRSSDAEISSPIQTPAALPPSPTAVPFHFRQPYRSSSTTRSLSQTPFSSNRSAADALPKQKTRPRSTEFKSSKEIRPLWLVERHRSHQEPAPDETYPSLPSSHTTSRSSSVHNVEGSERGQNGDYEVKEAEHEPTEVELGPTMSTDEHLIQSGLLDSQQATPTASSFQDSSTVLDLALPQSTGATGATGDSSPKAFAEESSQQSSSMLKNSVLGAVLGGSAALALNAAIQNNDPSPPDLSQEENEEFERGLDDMVKDTGTYQSDNDSLHQEEDFVPQKRTKSRKKKQKASQFQPNQPFVAEDVEAKPSTNSLCPEPPSPESMRQLQEHDAQDAVDSWSPLVLRSKKGKKGKKGKSKALVERSQEEDGPSSIIKELHRDSLQASLPTEVPESHTLAQEMSREQIVHIMTAAAQDAKDDTEPSHSATPVRQEPSEIPQDDLPHGEVPHQVLSKTQSQDDFPQGNLPQENLSQSPRSLPQDGNLRSDLLQDSSSALPTPIPTEVTFADPFLEQGHETVLQPPKTTPASQEELDSGDLTKAVSPSLELSPRATPLPDDDDEHDLFDGRLETPASAALPHLDNKRMEIAAENPLDVPLIHDSSAITPGPSKQSQDLPAQPEQSDANDYFVALSKNNLKNGKTASEDFSVEDSGSTDIQVKNRPSPLAVAPTTSEEGRLEDLNEETAMDVSKENQETVENEYGGVTSKGKGRKGKKAKQGFSVENSKTIESEEMQESFPEVAASEAPEDHEATNLIDESAFDAPQSKTERLDNWTKEDRKGKKVKPSFSIEDDKATEIEEENEFLSKMATSEAPEGYGAIDLIDENVMHAPKAEMSENEPKGLIDVPTNQTSKPEVVEDRGMDFDNRNRGQEIERQDSRTLDLKLGSDETDYQLERQGDGREDTNDRPSSLATTRTSQEVSAMLRLGETESSIAGETNEGYPAVSKAEDNVQKPSEDQIYYNDHRNLSVAYEPAIQQLEEASGKAQEGETSPNLDTSVASTDAARAVQDILAVENEPKSGGVMVTSPSVEGTATDILSKEDALDWDAPKRKKKGKKGKKNEASSWDEPEAIESAEVLDIPGAMNSPLVKEPMEEDEVGRDAPQEKKKKKSKKGKKGELFSLDKPEIMEPVELSGPTAATETLRSEEQPTVKAIDEVSSRKSKKNEKGKKGKRKGVSRAVSDFRDEDEPNDVPTETPPQGYYNARDLPIIASDFKDESQPNVVSSEPLQEIDRVEGRLAVATESREEVRPSVVISEAKKDDGKVEDLPEGDMPPMQADIGTPGDVAEPPVLIKLSRDNENGKPREAPLEQEEDFMPPKSKRDKKNSKKSKKSNLFSLDDDETLTTGDGQTSATRNSDKTEREQTIPSRSNVVEEPEKTAQQPQIEEVGDSMPFTNKKDKKKSKRSKKLNAFSLDEEIAPTLEYEPVSNHRDAEKEAHEQTLPSSVDVVDEPETLAGGLQQKDRVEIKEAQPFASQTDITNEQYAQENSPELNKDSEMDSNTDPPNASGDLVMVERKRGEPVHGDFDPVSAHATALGMPHKASSLVTPPLEQPVDASEAITANQANELQENFSPAVGTDIDPLSSFTLIQNDKEGPEKARPLIREEEGASREPSVVFEKSVATEDPAERSNTPVSQDSKSWSRPETSAQEIGSTEIFQPGLRSEDDQGFRDSSAEEQPSQARDENPTVLEAGPDESFENIREGKTNKTTKSGNTPILDPEEEWSTADGREHASVTATRSVQGNEKTTEQQPRDDSTPAGELRSDQEESAAAVKREQSPILTNVGAIDEARDKEVVWDVPVQTVENAEKQHDEVQRDGSGVEDISSSVAPDLPRESGDTVRNTKSVTNVEPLGGLDKDELIPAVEVGLLDAQEQHEHNKKYAQELERAVPNSEPVADFQPLGGPDMGKSTPAVEIEMLDAQEQREYNEEYAKELERQLSPLQESERGNPSRDGVDTPMFSQSGIVPVMERPYEEEHRPLARPPALEDIIEESGSRSGSVQGSPAGGKDNFSPVKSIKKSKKGKKGKKQQPIIWEDDTATPPQEPESDQGVEPFIPSLEGSGLEETDIARRVDLEEPMEQRSLEDRISPSPVGDFNTADKDYVIKNDSSRDYFAIQPSRPAEEDVGREDTREFRQALLTEPPYSTSNRSPAQEPQTAQASVPRDDAVKTDNQDDGFGTFAANSHDKSRTETEPVEEHVEDNFDSAPTNFTKNKGKKSGKQALAREPSPQALGQEDLMDRPKDFETQATDIMIERSPSRLHSSRSSLYEEDDQFSVAEGRPTSRRRSGSMGGVAAAVGLGVSALAAENLTRRDSKEEERLDKKAKEEGRWTDFEAGIGKSESPLNREVLPVEEEHRQTPESGHGVRERQHQRAIPPQSPPSTNYEAIADHPVVGDLGQSSEMPQIRDSAIYVSGSPVISEEIPYHRAARDSGYPDTEASPIIDDELENPDDPTGVESGVAAGERIGRLHSRAPESERQSSTSRNQFEVSVEASSDYDVSVSRPKERRKRSKRRSGAAYDSDDSTDSGFDIQRRRRREAMAGEPRKPSPVSSTTKDRSSALFGSSPSAREETMVKVQDQDASPRYDPIHEEPTWSFDHERPPQQRSRVASRERRSGDNPEHALESLGYEIPSGQYEDAGPSLFGGPRSHENDSQIPAKSPHLSENRGRQRLNTISEDSADGSPLHKKDKRAMSDVGSPESGVKGRRMRSPSIDDDVAGEYVSTDDPISRQNWPAADEEKHAVDERSRSRNSDHMATFSSRQSALSDITPGHKEGEYRTASAASMQSENSIHAIIRTPDQVRSASGLSYRSSGTPPLRRVDRSASGDLRGASRKGQAKSHAKSSSEFEPEPELDITIPSSSTYDPITDKGKSRADMADVYEGWGDVRGQSPMSPTRPPSMRKRQSMQLLDLETRLDQMVSENRLLASQKLTAEKALQEQARDHSQERRAYEEAMQEHRMYLKQKDSELSELKQIIEQLHGQAAHLTEVNEGLASSRSVDEEHQQRYSQLQAEHASTREQWQQSTRELENLKEQHTQLSSGMEDIVRHEVTVALEEKNLELRQLQNELENAKQQVRDLQQQLLASRNSDNFVERDEDYFDSQCQSLCQHVQQWVLRFSKFSDMKACYLASEIRDEKTVDRMENAILDGSDVDDYLSDRVKRRDVFMSVVMTMIWEFIFTRYLFGMDREQRQKLKNLEKTLQEVGPISAVHKWRATTLTLLMKRESFENQRATDTEAVVHEIYDTLATFLPPPSHLVGQIQDSLRKVINTAVDLSIEMRTQRAEYSMLPPLQPEYDTNGDLARKVYFSALTMNERSGATSSNETLQEQHAVVKMVLFPLIVKNEDDDEQIVVCPAQVLTAGSKGKKTVRVMSAQGGSEASFAGSDVRMEGGLI